MPRGRCRRLRPIVCAHRGASGTLPDNSLAAFEAAIASGCEAIETDLRRAPDGRIVLAHDETDAHREDVVELASLLALADGRVRLDLELKEPGLEQDLLAMIGGDRSSIVSSFSSETLRRVRELAPSLETGLIVEALARGDLVALAEQAGESVDCGRCAAQRGSARRSGERGPRGVGLDGQR